MSDARLFMTPDGGEVAFVNGQFPLDAGLEGAVILSLDGGNSADTGQASTEREQWWGNLEETDPARIYRGETGALLRGTPATSSNLQAIRDAAGRDLEWMLESIADTIAVDISMTARDRVKFNIEIAIGGNTFPVEFAGLWGDS